MDADLIFSLQIQKTIAGAIMKFKVEIRDFLYPISISSLIGTFINFVIYNSWHRFLKIAFINSDRYFIKIGQSRRRCT